jgi:kinesin family protein 2/24
VEKMEAERVARRQQMVARKANRAQEEQRNIALGNPGDVDFIGMVAAWRASQAGMRPHELASDLKICICVRKRPHSNKEREKMDHDSVTCLHPYAHVHSAKVKVDGITKYLDHQSFRFDQTFGDGETTEDVYKYAAMPLVDFVCKGHGGRATCVAYGQTGSGKTYTMSGVQVMVAEDIFMLLAENAQQKQGNLPTTDNTIVTVSFFELYGGRCQDLLNDRHRLKILEDGKGEVVVTELEEYEAKDPTEFLTLVNAGNRNRTTHATQANDTSSRSHAVCQILLRDRATGSLRGKLSLVDLAGSERGSDTNQHNRQRRTESSEINKSLLALKECIRALDTGGGHSKDNHVPYRASKLTLVLKDCFTSPLAKTVMIATVSPGASACDHTLNTLRYADRIKQQKLGQLSEAAVKERQVMENARKQSERMRQAEERGEDYYEDLPAPPRKAQPKAAAKETARRQPGVDSPVRGKASKSVPSEFKSPAREPYRRAVGAESPRPEMKSPEPQDDIQHLHDSLRSRGEENEEDSEAVAELHRTVEQIFEDEENLLNLHMSIIQENAELLTAEGKLLQAVQGSEDYNIDAYASKLETILERKSELIDQLGGKLRLFRESLRKEEELSRRVGKLSTE